MTLGDPRRDAAVPARGELSGPVATVIMDDMHPELEIDVAGLEHLARCCSLEADVLAQRPHAATAAADHQATVAAVTAIHRSTDAVAVALTARLNSTADLVTDASARFSASDEHTADRLRALAPGS